LDLLLVLSAYKLEVQWVELRVNEGNQVHDVTHQQELPSESCPYRSGSCDAGGLIYIWEPLASTCQMQIIRKAQLEWRGSLWVADADHLAFNVTGSLGGDSACGLTSLLTTNRRDLFITFTVDGHHLSPLESANVAEATGIEANLLYRQLRNSETRAPVYVNQGVCLQLRASRNKELTPTTTPGTFVKSAGHAVWTVQCKPKIGVVREMPQCYYNIPVTDSAGKPLFVHPGTSVSSEHGFLTPCSSAVPVEFEGDNGNWYTLNPKLTQLSAPEPIPQYLDTAVVEELTGNVYTEDQEAAWEFDVNFGAYAVASQTEQHVEKCLLNDCLPGQAQAGFPLLHEVEEKVEGVVHMFDPLYWVKHHSDELILSSFFYSIVAAGVSCLGAIQALWGLGLAAGMRVLLWGAMPALLGIKFERYMQHRAAVNRRNLLALEMQD